MSLYYFLLLHVNPQLHQKKFLRRNVCAFRGIYLCMDEAYKTFCPSLSPPTFLCMWMSRMHVENLQTVQCLGCRGNEGL